MARLFGDANVALARAWLTPPPPSPLQLVSSASGNFYTPLVTRLSIPAPINADAVDITISISSSADKPTNPWRTMFSPPYRQQTLLAVCLALSLQFSGINAVFFYSSSMFTDAGVADDRVGSLIVNVVNVLPSFGASWLAARFGNRTMIIVGEIFMLMCTVGLTVALLVDVASLSIAFTALYVAGFGVSLGPLAFVVAAEVFPDELRATGGSLATFLSWSGTLLVGVGYPYVADALGDLGFLPFMATLLVSTVYLMKVLPETSGKTSDEIQAMYCTKAM